MVTSKVKRRRWQSSINSKGILDRASQRKHQRDKRNVIKLNSRKFSNSLGSGNYFYDLFYLSNLNQIFLNYKNMELLDVLYEQYKCRKTKRAVEHMPFLKKIAAYQ
jgi:hypothetical protein